MVFFFFYLYGVRRELLGLTHSCPARLSSDRHRGAGRLASLLVQRVVVERLQLRQIALLGDDQHLLLGRAVRGIDVRLRRQPLTDRKSTRLNSSHSCASRMPSSA